MKTFRRLYAQIHSHANLYAAWRKARRGKRYGLSAAQFESNLAEELLRLHDELRSETYQPGGYRSFTVHEPKRRKISAAPFRDRVVHHALCNILVPIWERKFIHDTYANRVGKGVHAALDRCTYYMRRYRYVLQCDIQQFFPSIDHLILKAILSSVIDDEQTQSLCTKIIDSGVGILADEYRMCWFPGDDLLAALRPRGLPIGNLTSQFWANVYLNEFDHFVKRELKCRAYIRYVDDFLLFADDKGVLRAWRAALIERLGSLRLTLHENRAQAGPVEHGIPFLGFTVYPSHRRLKYRKLVYARKHILHRYALCHAGQLTRPKLDASVRGWVGHLQHADTWGLRASVFRRMIL